MIEVEPKEMFFILQGSKILGHVVSAEGVGIDLNNVDSVRKWPTPKTTYKVTSF